MMKEQSDSKTESGYIDEGDLDPACGKALKSNGIYWKVSGATPKKGKEKDQ